MGRQKAGYSRDSLNVRFKRLLHYWFIRYNPLYFFSAFCMLFDVYLVSLNCRDRTDGTAWMLGWKCWPLPESNTWLLIGTSIVLMFMALLLRRFYPVLTVFIVLLQGIQFIMPENMLEWGVLFIASAFIALVFGLAVNWTWRNGKTTLALGNRQGVIRQ